MNLPINLKLAKLLKEKEFNETCTTIVTEENTYHLVSSIEHAVVEFIKWYNLCQNEK